MVTISENIIIGETISHDAKKYLAGSPPSFYMEERTLVWNHYFL